MGASVDLKVENCMGKMDAKRGLLSPCIFRIGTIVIWRHGDDSIVHGTRAECRLFEADLGRDLIVKCRGVLGPDKSKGDIDEIMILNRFLRWVPGDGVRPEAI